MKSNIIVAIVSSIISVFLTFLFQKILEKSNQRKNNLLKISPLILNILHPSQIFKPWGILFHENIKVYFYKTPESIFSSQEYAEIHTYSDAFLIKKIKECENLAQEIKKNQNKIYQVHAGIYKDHWPGPKVYDRGFSHYHTYLAILVHKKREEYGKMYHDLITYIKSKTH